MQLLLATSNPHKRDEIESVWNELRTDSTPVIELVLLDSLDKTLPEPVEDQPTFEGNAVLKACHYARASGLPTIADDSGLEVDALGGAPGVISARYSGATGPRSVVDPANNQKLLNELGDTPANQRTARFVCAMAFASSPTPQNSLPKTHTVRGTVEGRILGPGDDGYAIDNPAGRGTHGFGYDPLFLVPDLGKTTAELSPEHKNRISHRGAAARLMWDELCRLLDALS